MVKKEEIMKRQAFLISVVVTIVFGLGQVGWAQEDGTVSLDDARSQMGLESNNYNSIEDIKKKYPNADFSNARWLKNHPDAAKRLFNNKRWFHNHPEVARKLYQDKEFMRKHPDFAKSIHNRRKWLEEHGDGVKEIKRHKREIRDDKRELKRDRRDIREAYRSGDKDKFREAMRDYGHDKRDLRHDRKELKRDKRNLKRNTKKKRRITGHNLGQRRARGNVSKGARAIVKSSERKHRR